MMSYKRKLLRIVAATALAAFPILNSVAFAEGFIALRGNADDERLDVYIHNKLNATSVSIENFPQKLYFAVVNGSPSENDAANDTIRGFAEDSQVQMVIDVENKRPFVRIYFLPNVVKDGQINLDELSPLNMSPLLSKLVIDASRKASTKANGIFKNKCVPITVYISEVSAYQSLVFLNSGLGAEDIRNCVTEGIVSMLGVNTDSLDKEPVSPEVRLSLLHKAVATKKKCISSGDLTVKCLANYGAE